MHRSRLEYIEEMAERLDTALELCRTADRANGSHWAEWALPSPRAELVSVVSLKAAEGFDPSPNIGVTTH